MNGEYASFTSYPIGKMTYLQEKMRKSEFDEAEGHVLGLAKKLKNNLRVALLIKEANDDEIEVVRTLLRKLDNSIEEHNTREMYEVMNEIEKHYEEQQKKSSLGMHVLKSVVDKAVKKPTTRKPAAKRKK